MSKMRRQFIIAAAVVAVGFALAVSVVLIGRHINRTRVIAEAVTPDGLVFKVTQSFNRNLGEPFTTSFFYRKPGRTNWNWRYYCHEDGYWGHGRVALDEPAKTATIYRAGQPTIRFNWETEIYTQLTYTQSGQPVTNGPDAFADVINLRPD